MTYDILEGTELEEEALSRAAMSFVVDAQVKKNALTETLEQNKRDLFYRLHKNGVIRSTIYEDGVAELEANYRKSVGQLQDVLLFQIAFLGSGNSSEEGLYTYPYNPDYTLDASGRYYAVNDYYMAMSDPVVRYALFQADPIAERYMGEFYATLYEKLRIYAGK